MLRERHGEFGEKPAHTALPPVPRRRPVSAQPPVFFGQILVEEGVLDSRQLRELIDRPRSYPEDARPPIGFLALEAGYLDEPRLLSMLDVHGRRLHLGELLVMRRLLSLEGLARAMREKHDGELLGETLLRLRLIDPTALAEGLAEQCGVASVPIFRIPVDPALARFINAPYAVAHGIVPVALRGTSLVVAVWSPHSLELAEEVGRSGGVRIIPVLTTRAEVEDRIREIYTPSRSEEPESRAA